MPQPVTYSAQDEMIRNTPVVQPVREVVPVDWERWLMRSYDHWSWTRDLRLWHTYSKGDRMDRVIALSKMRGRELDEIPKVASDKRRRYLTVILLREIEHRDGEPEVAQLALDALMGRKAKK